MSPTTTNGTDVRNTLSSDVRGSVRPAGKPSPGPRAANPGDGSARTRAIPQQDPVRQESERGKIRNFVSPHLEEIAPAVKTSWALNEQPPSVLDRAKAVIPTRAEVPNLALWLPAAGVGVICVLGTLLGQVIALAFATRARGAVATAAIVLALSAHEIASAITN